MPDTPGFTDPQEVVRARKKFVAIHRAKRRLMNRLADIDWEYDYLRPKLQKFENKVVTLGELPEPILVEDDTDTE